MDNNEKKVNEEIEVIDFFDDDDEASVVPMKPVMPEVMPQQVTPSYNMDPTPEIVSAMPEATPQQVTPSYNMNPTPEIVPAMPEVMPQQVTPGYNMDPTPEIVSAMPEVMPQQVTPSYNMDPTSEIVSAMPEAMPQQVTSGVTEMSSQMEVPNFSGFEIPGQDNHDIVGTEPSSIINTNNLNYSAFDVEDKNEENAYSTTIMPAIEPKEIVKTEEEKKILKDVEASTPTNLNDQLLKLEDTLSKNNLTEDIKKEEHKDEAKSNKKAMIFIVTIFVLLGLLILFLPYLVKLF